ncbi:MAG: cytochrome c peroxidase [Vicinamibacterales bacterium]
MRLLAIAALAVPLGLAAPIPEPATNPLTDAKIELGRRLFADTRLSKDGTIACTSCHDPERAFSKPEAVSPGVFGRRGRRNSPTIVNRAWGRVFFWDGRAATLEQQVLLPIQDPNEMDLSLEEASRKVALPVDTIAQALASYVRAQMSGNSRYDRFNAGERTVLSAEERVGLRVFQGRGNCLMCHVGPNFSDEKLHNTGVAWQTAAGEGSGGRLADEGGFAISGRPEEHGAFKTPTLREVGRTAPYMHDGSMATLDEVVDFYDRGGRPNPYLDKDMQRLDLADDEKRGLVAFLQVLSTR